MASAVDLTSPAGVAAIEVPSLGEHTGTHACRVAGTHGVWPQAMPTWGRKMEVPW